MANPAWDNLDEFLDPDDFAVVAEFRGDRGQGSPFTVNVVFDEPFMDAQLGEYLMDAPRPRVTCKAADVASLKRHDTAVINGIAFALQHDPMPDGNGMAVVELYRDTDG